MSRPTALASAEVESRLKTRSDWKLDQRRLQIRFGDDSRLAETLTDHRAHTYPPVNR